MKNENNAKILVVDDDPVILQTMKEYIEATGLEAFSASSAQEALEVMESEQFDIVITDIMMPGMNGLELTDRIKQNFDSDVIVMTGYSGEYSYEEAVGKGASDFVFKPIRFRELILRVKRVMRERKLFQEKERMLDRLTQLAITDGLTGLFNSRQFFEQLGIEISKFDRYNRPLTLLMLDIDHFKSFNDTHGHVEGDKVLVEFAVAIKTCLRNLDTAYRYGGEEFAVILPETTQDDAVMVAERIRISLESTLFEPNGGSPVPVTVSIGVSQYTTGVKVRDFVKRADGALYCSKENGRNQVSVAD